MPSFGEQYEASRQTNQAIRALEASVRRQVAQTFDDWDAGLLSDQAVRWKLEGVVRSSYRAAAAVGLAHLSGQAGIPRWKPRRLRAGALRTPYLDGLLADVQRNLREYKASNRDPVARTRAISRISHSAGVAASRGHTDALLRASRELVEDYGFIVRKVWRANFINHIPCELCGALDGAEVELDEEFEADNRLKVYGDLKGPPRHPRCMCWLVILIVGLENHDDDVENTEPTPERETMSTGEVQSLPEGIFTRLVAWLRKLVHRLRSDNG